jgi:hypothetical protein
VPGRFEVALVDPEVAEADGEGADDVFFFASFEVMSLS